MKTAAVIEAPGAEAAPPRARASRPGRRVEARLGFRRAGAKTILGAQRAPHPFHVTRPFHFESDPDGLATLYLQSSSGGLYGDDDLSLEIEAAPGAAAHVTTQASTVVHDARGGETRQATRLSVGAGALLEFCPDPQILFAGARLDASIEATIAPGARLALCDAALTHDPAARGRPFQRFRNEISLRADDGAALLIERAEIAGEDWARRTGGLPCHGAMIIVAGDGDEAARTAENLAAALDACASERLYAGVSCFPERRIALARFLAADGALLSAALDALWRASRLALTGAAPAPRPK